MVIGAGGLGCPALNYLAGSGIGTIGIADFDTVAVSNLHRQVLYNVGDAGLPKAPAAAAQLTARNPALSRYILTSRWWMKNNVLSLLDGYDIIMDCTDNFQSRYLINDACVVLSKPLVYGAIHQGEGHLTVFNYRQVAHASLPVPRNRLKTTAYKSCADIGAYNITTGIIGLLKWPTKRLRWHWSNRVCWPANCIILIRLPAKSRVLSYQPVAGSREKSIARLANTGSSIEISAAALQQKIAGGEPFILVDVREEDERLAFNIGGEHLPLEQFLRESSLVFNPADTVIVYCERGGRSLQSARHLREKGFTHAYSLQGGMHWWRQQYP